LLRETRRRRKLRIRRKTRMDPRRWSCRRKTDCFWMTGRSSRVVPARSRIPLWSKMSLNVSNCVGWF
jgi:hypothetical protein